MWRVCLLLFLCACGRMSHGTSARGIVKPIDVIIPCAYKDMETLPLCITGVKKYGEGVRRVIVISKDCLTDQAEWVNEGKFSFTKEDVARAIFENENDASAFLKSPRTRIGWIFQQLLRKTCLEGQEPGLQLA